VSNRKGLPAIYNGQICEENRGMMLLFVHDDVWLDDCYVYDRLAQALERFDVVGLAGNTRRAPRQPAWGFVSDHPLVWDGKAHLSGVVAHGREPGGLLSRYGPPGRPCKLLDGLFLAARCDTLLDRGVRFDERFMFHFYDMDFCRSAEQAGLSMGTWPIAVTHASDAVFGTASWREGLAAYFAKWGE